jgi:thioredoxin reductase
MKGACMEMDKYDVFIIGKGPAVISTALYTARANLKTQVVVGTDASANKKI